MKTLLFLSHRIPYPPDKGDKIRSYHLLRHLAANYRVLLGCFVDDPADLQHYDHLASWLGEVHLVPLSKTQLRFRAGKALLQGRSFSEQCYRDPGMRRWLDQLLQREQVDIALAYSSAMGQYLQHPGLTSARKIIDFVDLDSEKWREYAQSRRGLVAWLYRREAHQLLDLESRLAWQSDHSLFITPEEVTLFQRRSSGKLPQTISSVGNGVDLAYFFADFQSSSPYPSNSLPIVFTGMMDYQPNIKAVEWFVNHVFPRLQQKIPGVRFYIVGANPCAQVMALARVDGVVVTGRVEDIRPYLVHARFAVAPLQVGRGIQNKVLEAMAMGVPIIASPQALCGIDRQQALQSLAADSANAYIEQISQLLACDTSYQARRKLGLEWVRDHFSWPIHLQQLDKVFQP